MITIPSGLNVGAKSRGRIRKPGRFIWVCCPCPAGKRSDVRASRSRTGVEADVCVDDFGKARGNRLSRKRTQRTRRGEGEIILGEVERGWTGLRHSVLISCWNAP